MKNYTITVNGNVYDVVVEERTSTETPAMVKPPVTAKPAAMTAKPAAMTAKPAAMTTKPAAIAAEPAAGSVGGIKIEAGAAGKVFKIAVSIGEAVKAGDDVVILEAMKMEIPMKAPQDGSITSIDVAVGDPVEAGALLATMN